MWTSDRAVMAGEETYVMYLDLPDGNLCGRVVVVNDTIEGRDALWTATE